MSRHKAYIAVGSNIGNRLMHLQEAVEMLEKLTGTTVNAVSAVYMTEPVGDTDQERFFNGVVLLETVLEPEALRQSCKTIERDLGRPEAYRRWSPRVIDLDILLFDNLCIRSETLCIPHPEMHNRKFVLVPLLDISNPLHPSSGETASGLLRKCSDRSVLVKLKETLAMKQ
ncbi:MAG: 2-amino-4-hydroxy-6-hydroxymethyldihydropteridine diphosphokinase [Chlorobiaceae bacterium]|nr:2-amino-4-hydroxy-6-hydroxymethyldihydropteridine diphosphokinase [Chlorobiaceae bacterium]NTV61283.1 2-amino-4-hydroxy-6-hydroxymethyldihydropteridine diphosphokinase [Chlorobiaceae bacterium]